MKPFKIYQAKIFNLFAPIFSCWKFDWMKFKKWINLIPKKNRRIVYLKWNVATRLTFDDHFLYFEQHSKEKFNFQHKNVLNILLNQYEKGYDNILETCPVINRYITFEECENDLGKERM